MTDTIATSSNIERVAVIGGGTMGRGIAQVAAMAGMRVSLCDVSSEVLEHAATNIRSNLERGVAKGKVDAESVEPTLARIHRNTSMNAALADVQTVVEAVPERMDLKQSVLKQAAQAAPAGALLASNTSSLSLTELAAACPDPHRVVGMHFFNPVHLVSLLELVRAEQTSDAIMAQARSLGLAMQREVIEVQDSPGFATSRLGLALGLEAIRMVEQGVASAEDIDRGMTLGYRHPMGPLRLTDLVGLDVRLAIAETLHRELGGEQFRPPPLLRRMVRAGYLGKKSGRGFYEW